IMFPYSGLLAFDAEIQRSLTTHGRQYSVDVMLFEDCPDGLLGQRQKVHVIGRHVVRHDRRRIGVGENHLDAFVLERTGCLGSCVIELTSLAKNNGTAPDDQNGAYTSVSRHLWG